MQSTLPFKIILVLLLACSSINTAFSQSRPDIIDPKAAITWLGIDYSQAKYINPDSVEIKDGHHVTNYEFKNIYIPFWDYLVISEGKKYNIAKALHRSTVAFALDVTQKGNERLDKDFFAKSTSGIKPITEQTITDLVKGYDFQGNTGIGCLFFVGNMVQANKEAEVWVTFVNMDSKTVITTIRHLANTGGIGFRNHWAAPIYKVMKQLETTDPNWGRSMPDAQ